MLVEIIVAAACILAILSIGNAIVQRVFSTRQPLYERISLSTGAGVIALAAYAFVVNLFGYGYWWILALPLAVATPLWIGKLKPAVERIKSVKKRVLNTGPNLKIALALLALLFSIGFFTALAPPSTTRPGPVDYDSLNYHLLIPKKYVAQHSLERIEFLPYDNWPHALEMFYTIPMSLASEASAKLVMLFISFAMLLGIFSLARRFVPSEKAIIAPLIFASSPVIFLFFGSAYVDSALAFFVVLSLLALNEWLKEKKWHVLALAGAFAGFAASVKLIGLISLALITLIAAYYALRKNKTPYIVPFAFFSALFIAPWLIRTFIATGNPIFPLYYAPLAWIGVSPAGTEYFMARWAQGAVASGGGQTLLNLVLLPWNLTMHGNLFNGIISPLYLMLAPFLALTLKKTSKFEKILLAFAAIFTIAWFYLYQETRFYAPVLAIGAVLMAIAVARFPSLESVSNKATLFVMSIAVCIAFLYGVSAFPVALGLEAKNAYLNHTLDTYAPCKFMNGDENVKKVLFYNVEKGYYCNKPFVYSFAYDTRAASKDTLLQQLKSDGFTHILSPVELNEISAIRDLLFASQAIYTTETLEIYALP